MPFKTLKISILISLFFLFSCKPEGQFTIIEGKVTDENGQPAAGAELRLYNPGLVLLTPSFVYDTIRTTENGSYSYAFFNKESVDYIIRKNEDKEFKCSMHQDVLVNRRNILNFETERKRDLLKYRITHEIEDKPNNFTMLYEYQNGRCRDRHSFNYEISGNIVSDTVTEYLLKIPFNDTINLEIRALRGEEFIGENNFNLQIGTDTILLESTF